MSQYRCSSFCSFYRGEKFIQGYIENMLEQSVFNETQFIFVDCASPENESQYILPLVQKYPNIKYYRLDEDPGLYAGWNIAIEECSASIITNWNIDDRKSKDGLEILLIELENDQSLDMIYGLNYVSHIPNETYEQNSKQELFKCNDHSFKELLKHNSPHCMPMWRKKIHNKCGMFNEKYGSISDAEMWLKLCVHNGIIKKINKPVGLYYWNPTGKSTDKTLLDKNHKDLEEAKIEILTQIKNIDTLFTPIKEYEKLYKTQTDIGKIFCKERSIVFLAIAKNIDSIILNDSKIIELLNLFKKSTLYIYEYSSLNNKPSKQLQSLANKNSNIKIISNITENNSILYNDNLLTFNLINLIKDDIKNYNFITFLNIDFIDLSISGVLNTFGYFNADASINAMCGFNVQKEIYNNVNRLFLVNKDTEAYRNNFWSDLKEVSCEYTYDYGFSYRMMNLIIGSPPIPAYSSYGGFITYKTKDFMKIKPKSSNENIFIQINKELQSSNSNFSLFMNPSQVMLSYYDNK